MAKKEELKQGVGKRREVFGELSEPLNDNGFCPIPVNKRDKAPKLPRWPEARTNEKISNNFRNNKNAKGERRNFNSYNVGVVTGEVVAVDVDIYDTDLAQETVDYIVDHLGQAPIRIGQPPKALLLYQIDTPVAKMSTARYEDFISQTAQIEVLGLGQQFVAYGTHPDTGNAYQWVDDIGPANTPVCELQSVTYEDLTAVLSDFDKKVSRDKGWSRIVNGRVGRSIENLGEEELLDAIELPIDIKVRDLKKAVMKLCPDNYDFWVEIGMALHHQFDGSNLGLQMFDEWSRKTERDNYELTSVQDKWASFSDRVNGRYLVTARSIVKYAKDIDKEERLANTSGFVHHSFVRQKLQKTQWLVQGMIECNSFGQFFGASGTFKSFMSLSLAYSVALGRSWHERAVDGGAVIYLAGEGMGGMARRIAAFEQMNNIQSPNDAPLFFSELPIDLTDDDAVELIVEQIQEIADTPSLVNRERYEKNVADDDPLKDDTPGLNTPRLIVIDTLARNFGGGDENSTKDMNKFVTNVDVTLRSAFPDCTVLVVHHTGKGNKSSPRGAYSLYGASDFVYRFDRHDNRGELVVEVVNMKMKDGEDSFSTWFQGERIIVIEDLEEPVTSLAFSMIDEPIIEVPAPELSNAEQEELDFITDLIPENDGLNITFIANEMTEIGLVGSSRVGSRHISKLCEMGYLRKERKAKEIMILTEYI